MLKKLRLKFVLINMSIVTIMLCVILGLVFYFTSANLEAASINMMQNIAANPLHLGVPNEREKDIRVVSFSRSAVCRADSSSVGFITVLLFFSQISTNSISVPRSRSRASRARTDSHTVAVLSLG